MKKEDTRTYAMAMRVRDTPGGLMSTDFLPYTGCRVNKDFQPLIDRGVMTKAKEGYFNRYSVSAAQWAKYAAETPLGNFGTRMAKIKAVNLPEAAKKAATQKTPGPRVTRLNRLIELAGRPKGVTSAEKVDSKATPKGIGLALGRMHERGMLFRVRTGPHHYTYFASKAQADAFDNPYSRPIDRTVSNSASSFCAPDKRKQDKQTSRAKWNATPAYLPYDDAGRPLFKVTICPGFTADPPKSNTFSGAY